MQTHTPTKAARTVLKRIHITVSEGLHTAMKMAAAEAKTTVKGFVTQAIEAAVEKKGGKRSE
jgi:predicted HicB family RNase H-like nuclease